MFYWTDFYQIKLLWKVISSFVTINKSIFCLIYSVPKINLQSSVKFFLNHPVECRWTAHLESLTSYQVIPQQDLFDWSYFQNFQITVTFSYWYSCFANVRNRPVYMVTNYFDYLVLSFAKIKKRINQCRWFVRYNVLTLKTRALVLLS